MWQIKYFKTEKTQEEWIRIHSYRYQIVRLFVNNGYAVEFKKLRMLALAIAASLASIAAPLALASTAKAQQSWQQGYAAYGPYYYPNVYAPAVIVPPYESTCHYKLWGLGGRCDSFCQQNESDRVLLGR